MIFRRSLSALSLIAIGFFTFLTSPLNAQSSSVSGKVTSADNDQPMVGVNILVQGTDQGTSTDTDGNYTIVLDNPGATLVFSYIGYTTKKVLVDSQTTLNMTLEIDALGLDEVIAIGYGYVKKSDLTGSVGTIDKKLLNSQAVENPLMALTGTTSGVQVLQNSGEPGSSFGVRIRGSNSLLGGNSPLYVVDGFPISGNLDNLNANDISSVEVLKDASATAIYGSRGANGVVLVSTKKGANRKTTIEYSSYTGTQSETKRIDMLNAKEFATLANYRASVDGESPFFTQAEVSSFGEGTDWQDLIFRPGNIENHSLMFSGGNETTRFGISGNYFKHSGVILNSFSDRFQIKLDVDHDINDKWNISVQNILSRNKKNKVMADNNTRGSGIVDGALNAPPTLSPKDANGNWQDLRIYPFSPDVMENPVMLANEVKDETTKNSDLLNIAVEGEIADNLRLRSTLGIEYYDKRGDYYSSTKYNRSYDGNAEIMYEDFTNVLNENTLTYTKLNDDYSMEVLGGITSQQTTTQDVWTSTTGYLVDVMENYRLQSGTAVRTPTSGYVDYSILSYLGRANFALKNKYLITTSFRMDGSSRFGANSKWGTFPSFAVAWRLSEEEFWPTSLVNSFKLRGGWGNTGNTAVAPYQSLNTLTTTTSVFDDNIYTGFAPGTTKPNPDLKWENTSQVNVGIDMGLFENRLSFVFDYYKKTTTDLLANVPLPTSSGFSSITSNIGTIENSGIEISSNYQYNKNGFSMSLGGNISMNDNKVVELSQGQDLFGVTLGLPISVPISLVREGQPLGVFYAYKEDGINADGTIKYVDQNGDGAINAIDRVVIGDPNPDYIFGINSSMSYKNFGLSVVITGVQGNDVFNFNRSNVGDGFAFGINQMDEVKDNYWTSDNNNTDADYGKISQYTRYDASDRHVEDGSYVKIQNLELSYTFNDLVSSPFDNLQVYLGGQNLLTWTNYSWYSPEVNTQGADISRGIDMSGYPMVRTMTFGIRIKL
jgi:TonB-linked SusC/RagA family outer membrane protein